MLDRSGVVPQLIESASVPPRQGSKPKQVKRAPQIAFCHEEMKAKDDHHQRREERDAQGRGSPEQQCAAAQKTAQAQQRIHEPRLRQRRLKGSRIYERSGARGGQVWSLASYADVDKLLALARDAEQRHWLGWSLEAKLAAWELLHTQGTDSAAANALRLEIATTARQHGFGRILNLLQRGHAGRAVSGAR